MLYSGFEQNICVNGHRYDTDIYADAQNCPHCGAKAGYSNGVDTTNGDDRYRIPTVAFAKFLISPAKTKVCNLGHLHTIEEAVYRVPSTLQEADQLAQSQTVDVDGRVRRLDCLEEAENLTELKEWGLLGEKSTCLDLIISALERDDRLEAIRIADHDGDKLRQYPEVWEYILDCKLTTRSC